MTARLVALLTALVLAAAALTSCSSSSEHRAQAVCIDPVTQQRLPDGDCGTDSGDALWWYFRYGHAYPPVGRYVTHHYAHDYTTTAPASGFVRGGASTRGGKVTTSSLAKGTPTSPSSKAKDSSKPSSRASSKSQSLKKSTSGGGSKVTKPRSNLSRPRSGGVHH